MELLDSLNKQIILITISANSTKQHKIRLRILKIISISSLALVVKIKFHNNRANKKTTLTNSTFSQFKITMLSLKKSLFLLFNKHKLFKYNKVSLLFMTDIYIINFIND